MAKYHINPETGNPGICKAEKQCRFGPASDHYTTPQEARDAFEARMDTPRPKIGEPILLKPNKLNAPNPYWTTSGIYEVDYEYDSYRCSDPVYCAESDDYCRDSVYEGLRISGWADPDGVKSWAKNILGLQDKPLDPDLVDRLKPYEDMDAIKDEFEIYGESGYYGEEVAVEYPPRMIETLKDYYYDQPDSAGPHNILSYLREKGFPTKGYYPLDAIKASLRAENNGKLNKKVEAAKSWRMATIGLKSIVKPSQSQAEEAAKNPRQPKATSTANSKAEIAGVVMEENGQYTLIDGYHRTAFLEQTGRRRRATYIILSKEANHPRRYGYNNSPSWETE